MLQYPCKDGFCRRAEVLKERRVNINMRKAGLHQTLLFCLCICLGIFLTGCSGQSNQEKAVSDDVEYQAENEASNMEEGDFAADAQQKQKDAQPESSAESSSEEVLITDNITVYDYAYMENVLAAVVSAMDDEEISRCYTEKADDNFVAHYLYAYVNMFDHDTFKSVSMQGKTHDSYVRLEADYLSSLMIYAFGDAIKPSQLKADGDLVLKKGSDYYVALDEVLPVVVDYTGFENENYTDSTVFPFDYELTRESGETEDGIMQVRFQESDQVEEGITLKVISVTRY